MSVRFSSNASFATLAAAGPSGVGAFCGWVQPLAFTGTYGVFVLVNALHYLGIHPNLLFIFTTSEQDGSALSLNTWYFVAMNWNETSGVIEGYLSNVLDVSDTDFAPSGAPSLNFGSGGGSFYFDGAVRGFRVWDGVNLSIPEFTAEGLSQTPVRLAGLFDEWDFESAANAADSFSGTHDLTVGGLIDGPDNPPPYAAAVGGLFLGVMP